MVQLEHKEVLVRAGRVVRMPPATRSLRLYRWYERRYPYRCGLLKVSSREFTFSQFTIPYVRKSDNDDATMDRYRLPSDLGHGVSARQDAQWKDPQ